jgi:hypothetical protein
MAILAILALLVCVGASACGGGGSPSGPSDPLPNNPNRFTIGPGGIVSPKEVTIQPGTRVLFINNDTRRWNISSDPHPEHDECPAINQVDYLNPGQFRETGNFTTIRTCGFHDHDFPDNNNLKGRIVIR